MDGDDESNYNSDHVEQSGLIEQQAENQFVPDLSQSAAISLGSAVEGVRQAKKRGSRSKETSQRAKLQKLGEKGVRLDWWSQERFDSEVQRQLDQTASSDQSSGAETDASYSWTEATKLTVGAPLSKKKGTPKTATLKLLPLDSLMDEKDQLWKNPRRSKHFNERLGHLTWPKFEGDRRLDKLSAVQWATEVSAMLFWDVGVPIEDALYLLRRCFPENSRTKDWHTAFLNKNVSPTFDMFMRGFVPAFTDPSQAAEDRADLLVLKQHSLAFWDFASKHRALWRKVNPDTTEEELVRNWECRLNDQCRDIFQEYLMKLRSDNKLPSYSHALDHMERKLKRKSAKAQDTVFAIKQSDTRQDTRGEEWIACERGCRAKKHRKGQSCPASRRECNQCGETGHFRSSSLCPKFVAKATTPAAAVATVATVAGTGANAVL